MRALVRLFRFRASFETEDGKPAGEFKVIAANSDQALTRAKFEAARRRVLVKEVLQEAINRQERHD